MSDPEGVVAFAPMVISYVYIILEMWEYFPFSFGASSVIYYYYFKKASISPFPHIVYFTLIHFNFNLIQSAVNGKDYRGGEGTIEFKHGETHRAVNIPIIDDMEFEKDENFEVRRRI